ncbi:thioesterase family protein [Ruminococcus flavefaciens]|uniref:thioesterase family protein n=1 Tax=Ruminococcus flavefaciens TaxID=1265 RepID=UPI0026EA42E1|nr:thioesterase family protein [Ruminococcus flavefaciens]
MKDIKTGAKGSATVKAEKGRLASDMGSGCLNVFATPAMIALMENAACNALADFLEGDETTVGTALDVQHLSATPEGMDVTAEAVLTAVNGREFTFDVTSSDKAGLIGKGTHKRFLVYSGKFLEKTQSKLK